eukprot:TRINITY_DN22067_c1_g1_i1.p1 TRINITY_DN22067_c1_g1~~TRINITY_DN22067_c1_g1_i1.p1  ORF type:complete len:1688 (+),score=418.64 TRINITY_DN22067_c1_g1_i1:163-5226(+)
MAVAKPPPDAERSESPTAEQLVSGDEGDDLAAGRFVTFNPEEERVAFKKNSGESRGIGDVEVPEVPRRPSLERGYVQFIHVLRIQRCWRRRIMRKQILDAARDLNISRSPQVEAEVSLPDFTFLVSEKVQPWMHAEPVDLAFSMEFARVPTNARRTSGDEELQDMADKNKIRQSAHQEKQHTQLDKARMAKAKQVQRAYEAEKRTQAEAERENQFRQALLDKYKGEELQVALPDAQDKLQKMRALMQAKVGKMNERAERREDAQGKFEAFATFQRRWRGMKDRDEFRQIKEKWERKQELILYLQTRYRGSLDMKEFALKLKNHRALYIQTRARGKRWQQIGSERKLRAERTYYYQDKAALAFQTRMRGYLAVREGQDRKNNKQMREELENEAALWMQTRLRGKAWQKKGDDMLADNRAARYFQRRYRGIAQQRIRKPQLEAQRKLRAEQEWASSWFQRRYRGIAMQEHGIRLEQKHKERMAALEEASSLMQKRFRGKMAKDIAAEKARVRDRRLYALEHAEEQAVLFVQTRYRAHIVKQSVAYKKAHFVDWLVNRVQRRYRGFAAKRLARLKQLQRTEGDEWAQYIQTRYRGNATRKKALEKKAAATAQEQESVIAWMQRRYRGTAAKKKGGLRKKEHDDRVDAVRRIEKWYLAEKRARRKRRFAGSTCWDYWLLYVKIRRVEQRVWAARKIQHWWRESMYAWYEKRGAAVELIQTWWRRIARRKLEAIRKQRGDAATRIQRRYKKRYAERVEILTAAAIPIQRRMRIFVARRWRQREIKSRRRIEELRRELEDWAACVFQKRYRGIMTKRLYNMPKIPCIVCGRRTWSACSGCKAVYYCSMECRNKHWFFHRQQCSRVGMDQCHVRCRSLPELYVDLPYDSDRTRSPEGSGPGGVSDCGSPMGEAQLLQESEEVEADNRKFALALAARGEEIAEARQNRQRMREAAIASARELRHQDATYYAIESYNAMKGIQKTEARRWEEADESSVLLELTIIVRSAYASNQTHLGVPFLEKLIDVTNVLALTDMPHTEFEPRAAAALLLTTAELCLLYAEPGHAEVFGRGLIVMSRTAYGDSSPAVGDAHAFMAGLLARCGRHEEALLHAELVVKIRQRNPEAGVRRDNSLADAKWNVGLLKFQLGQFEEASALVSLAHSIYSQSDCKRKRSQADTAMALLCFHAGEIHKAGQYCKQALHLTSYMPTAPGSAKQQIKSLLEHITDAVERTSADKVVAARERAATRLQAVHRGRATRVKLRRQREREEAVRRIQRVQRGRISRRRAPRSKEEYARQQAAATRIQSQARCRFARRKKEALVAQQEGAATKLQSIQRGRVARHRVSMTQIHRGEAAMKIQAVARGRAARKAVKEKRQMALEEKQPVHKTWSELNDFEKELVKSVGWTPEGWEAVDMSPLERSWTTLLPRERDVFGWLGFHEDDFDKKTGGSPSAGTTLATHRNWAELTELDKSAVEMMGWTRSAWEQGDAGPLMRSWQALSRREQGAMLLLGFGADELGQEEEEEAAESESSIEPSSDGLDELGLAHECELIPGAEYDSEDTMSMDTLEAASAWSALPPALQQSSSVLRLAPPQSMQQRPSLELLQVPPRASAASWRERLEASEKRDDRRFSGASATDAGLPPAASSATVQWSLRRHRQSGMSCGMISLAAQHGVAGSMFGRSSSARDGDGDAWTG